MIDVILAVLFIAIGFVLGVTCSYHYAVRWFEDA